MFSAKAGFSIDADIRVPGAGGRHAVIADDDDQHRAALARHLAERGYTVSEVTDGIEALAAIGAEGPCVALLRRRPVPGGPLRDGRIPDGQLQDGQLQDDGDRAAALASMLYPRTRIILTDNQPDPVPEDSPFPVLVRPVDPVLLDRCLDGLPS